MNFTKPTHIAFIVASIVTIFVAAFFEKFYLIYVQPFTVFTILLIYFIEKKEPTSVLYILSQCIGLAGGILLILGMRYYLEAISILFSLFYIIYLRLMYVRNNMTKPELRTYLYLIAFAAPILYIYYNVIDTISSELKDVVIYFSCLMFFMLSYIITALYYYLKDKKPTNLWMFIAAINLGFMNILIGLNELYLYDTVFTVIVTLCSLCIQVFVLKFMLHDGESDTDFMKLMEE